MIFDNRTWLKASDIKDGTSLIILDEGDWVTSGTFTKTNGEPKKDFVCKVDYEGKQCDLTINKTRKDVLIAAYGKDSAQWVKKVCKVKSEDINVGGKKLKTIVLLPVDGAKSNLQYEP